MTLYPGLEFKPVERLDELVLSKKTKMERNYYTKQSELFGFDMIRESKEKFDMFYEMRSRKNQKNSEKYYRNQ